MAAHTPAEVEAAFTEAMAAAEPKVNEELARK